MVCVQESTMWLMVLVWCSPHQQFGDCVSPHLHREALQRPWPVRKPFNNYHEQRGRSKPGCRVVKSTTMAWLVTEADCQSSFHCVIMATGGKSNQMRCRHESCEVGWLKTSAWTGQSWWLSIFDKVVYRRILSVTDTVIWLHYTTNLLTSLPEKNENRLTFDAVTTISSVS